MNAARRVLAAKRERASYDAARPFVVENWASFRRLASKACRAAFMAADSEHGERRAILAGMRAARATLLMLDGGPVSRLLENPNHEPAGSAKGGQFAPASGTGSATKEEHVAKVTAKWGPAHEGYGHAPGKYGLPYKPGSKEWNNAYSSMYKAEKAAKAKADPKPASAPIPAAAPKPPSAAGMGRSGLGDKISAAPQYGYGQTQPKGSTYQQALEKAEPGQTVVSVPKVDSKGKATGGYDKYVTSSPKPASEYPNGTLLHEKTQAEHDAQVTAALDKAKAAQDAAKAAGVNEALRQSLIERTAAAGLTKAEEAAVTKWSGGAYGAINAPLHEGKGSIEDLKTAKAISDAINKAPDLAAPITVFRGQGYDPPWAKEGGTGQLAGFHGASIDPNRAFGGHVRMEITTRKGLYIEKLSHHSGEKELLINHGAHVRVTSRTETKVAAGYTKILIKMEVL